MKTEAQIKEAISMCEASATELKSERILLANHVAHDVLKWVLDQPCEFGWLLEASQNILTKRN